MKPCFQVSGENGERNSPAAAADEYPRYQSRAVPISCGAMRSIDDIFSPVVHLDLNFPANLCLTTFVLSLCTKCIQCSRNIHSFVVLPFLLRFSPAFLTTEIGSSVQSVGAVAWHQLCRQLPHSVAVVVQRRLLHAAPFRYLRHATIIRRCRGVRHCRTSLRFSEHTAYSAQKLAL